MQEFAAILRLLQTPKVFLSKLLNSICERFPSVLKGDRGVQVVGPGVTDSKLVSSFGFLLLEEVEGVLGTTEMNISSMRLFNLVEPVLSAIGSRMTRQLLPVTSASIEMIQILDENSVQAFDALMHIQQTTNMCLRIQGEIGRAGWETLSKAIKHHQPGLIWTVITSREALVEADRGDINSIWDALEIFFYICKNTKEAKRALGNRQLGGTE